MKLSQKPRPKITTRSTVASLLLLGGLLMQGNAPAQELPVDNNYYWTGSGDGNFNSTGESSNWFRQGQIADIGSSAATFGYPGYTPTTNVVSLNAPISNTLNFNYGHYVFQMNGNDVGSATQGISILRFSDAQGGNGTVTFDGPGTVFISGLNLGNNVQIGTEVAPPYQLMNGAELQVSSSPGSLNVGTTEGGQHTVFRVTADSIFNAATFTSVSFRSGSDSVPSNNRLEVIGGNLTTTSNINIAGNTAANAGNRILVSETGLLSTNATGTLALTVGPGSEAKIESGGKYLVATTGALNVNVNAGAVMTVSGADSEYRRTSSLLTGALTLNGTLTIEDGGSMTYAGRAVVNASGRMSVDGGSWNQDFTYSTATVGEVAGRMEFINGATGLINARQTSGSTGTRLNIQNGGVIEVSGESELNITGSSSTFNGLTTHLAVLPGGLLDIKGNSTVRTAIWAAANSPSQGTTKVENGSSLIAEQIIGTNLINIEGRITYGTGAGRLATNNTTLAVGVGVGLVLGGGTFEWRTSAPNASVNQLTLAQNSSLEGSGTIGNYSRVRTDGTGVTINPGINKGAEGASGLITFGSPGLTVGSNPTFEFDIFAPDSFDQVRGPITWGVATAPAKTLKMNVWTEELTEFDVFQIFESGTGVANIVFDFTQSAPVLAALGLSWDTSSLSSTGEIKLKALPEPEVATLSATDITTTSATLQGSVNAGGAPNTVRFEYGVTPAYGQTIEAVPATVTETSVVSATLTGLLPDTTYHFRVVSNNLAQDYQGEGFTFTTLPLSSIQSWRQQWFGTTDNVGNAADTSTPAGDSIPNLMKFSTTDGSADPWVPGVMPGEINIDDETLTFTYLRNKAAVGLVTFAVKWSDTLQANSWSSEGVVETDMQDLGAIEQVTVTIPRGTGTKRFVRLEATLN